MWLAIVEFIGRMASVPIIPPASELSLYSLSSALVWIAATLFSYQGFSLSLAMVVEKEAPNVEEPRHIAYAWSCGLTGMTILSFESFHGLELQFEDLLLGVAGLNVLVEEVRLRIVLSRSDSEKSKVEAAKGSTDSDHSGNPINKGGASVRRLVFRLVFTILVICLASWAARWWFPPAPELVARSGYGEASLEWTLSVDDFSGHFEYQQRLLNGAYPDAWNATRESRKHVVQGLENGLVYVFRIRAVQEHEIPGAPSNEASVVPVVQPADRASIETQLETLMGKVATLEARYSCVGEVLGDVRFEHDSASVLPASNADLATRNEAALNAVLTRLRDAKTDLVVVVTGYASAPGRASHNLDLSESRSLAVIEYLSQRAGAWNGEFAALANGERRDRVGGRDDDRDRRAVVALCPSGDEPRR